jgi:hypothetical protein
MNIEITGATVLLHEGCDKVVLHTNFSCPFVKEFLPSQPNLCLSFDASYDTGVKYCKEILGIDPEVNNIR